MRQQDPLCCGTCAAGGPLPTRECLRIVTSRTRGATGTMRRGRLEEPDRPRRRRRRRPHRAGGRRGGARAPSPVRGLVAAEGEAEARRDGAGRRAARGRRGDGAHVRARARAGLRASTATRWGGRRASASGRCACWTASSRPTTRSTSCAGSRRAAALDLLSYERDCRVLRSFGHDPSRPPLLVRHAAAVKRGEWAGDDRLRPLGSRGMRQAAGARRRARRPRGRADRLQPLRPLRADHGAAGRRPRPRRSSCARSWRRAREPPGCARSRPAPGTVVCVHGDLVADVLGAGLPKGSTTLLDLPSLAGDRDDPAARVELRRRAAARWSSSIAAPSRSPPRATSSGSPSCACASAARRSRPAAAAARQRRMP